MAARNSPGEGHGLTGSSRDPALGYRERRIGARFIRDD